MSIVLDLFYNWIVWCGHVVDVNLIHSQKKHFSYAYEQGQNPDGFFFVFFFFFSDKKRMLN